MTMIDTIHENAKTAKWVGVLLIIAGVLTLFVPFAAGISVAMLIGLLLVFGGISQVFLAFRAGAFGPGLLLFLLGALSAITGVYMLARPGVALASLTLFLAGYFIVAGIAEVIGAFGARPRAGWGWLLFSGIVSVLLGIMIWRQFPLSGAWAVGVLTGIRLLMSGMALTAIGSAVGGATEA
jgi:uncharacterized membrane protein HdeD (DUF308 family)